MSFVHVYFAREEKLHNLEKGADCICEPKIITCANDTDGKPARVFVHEKIEDASK